MRASAYSLAPAPIVSTGTPSDAAKSPGPKTSASSGAPNAAIRSTSTSPRTVSICTSSPTPSWSRSATARTCSTDSTFGTTITPAPDAAARSSSHHSDPTPLIRTASVPRACAAARFARAATFSAAAVPSSRSTTTSSAASSAAFASMRGFDAGTARHERRGRAGTAATLSRGPLASRAMKGVILAGGSGTRLHPLTRITNKHLLPLYDRPMVTYAVEALVGAGIEEVMLVTGGTHAGEFFRLLGNGHEHGIDRLFYAYQEQAGGIAEAFALAERFVARDKVCVLLADNVFEHSLRPMVENFARQAAGARIVLS